MSDRIAAALEKARTFDDIDCPRAVHAAALAVIEEAWNYAQPRLYSEMRARLNAWADVVLGSKQP